MLISDSSLCGWMLNAPRLTGQVLVSRADHMSLSYEQLLIYF